ncbi:MAG: hypothetical protein RX318_10010 [bacterium]|nr:hypothetical protein [bacterium]
MERRDDLEELGVEERLAACDVKPPHPEGVGVVGDAAAGPTRPTDTPLLEATGSTVREALNQYN